MIRSNQTECCCCCCHYHYHYYYYHHHHHYYYYNTESSTMAQSVPDVVAMIVAALGMLYIKASSPKLPVLSYEPTFLPPTRISYTPLHTHTQTKYVTLCNFVYCESESEAGK